MFFVLLLQHYKVSFEEPKNGATREREIIYLHNNEVTLFTAAYSTVPKKLTTISKVARM